MEGRSSIILQAHHERGGAAQIFSQAVDDNMTTVDPSRATSGGKEVGFVTPSRPSRVSAGVHGYDDHQRTSLHG